MLNTDSVNKFFVRIKELSIFPEVEGKVVYVREVSQAGIKLSMTDDCRPLSKVYQLPPSANDSGWYDVTRLIMAANSLILPRYDKCVFASDVAMSYRNVVLENPKPLEESAAVGKLCMLGTANGRTVSFNKSAYYIVSVDDNGYILAYSGFCQPLEEWEKPNLQQRILRIVGTGRRFYAAEPIVTACNAAYEEDSEKAQVFSKAIKDAVSVSSTDSTVGRGIYGSQLSQMQLG